MPLRVRDGRTPLISRITVLIGHSYLVDIFAMVPQSAYEPRSASFSNHDARVLHYREVLAKVSTTPRLDARFGSPSTMESHGDDDWLAGDNEDDAEAMSAIKIVGIEETGPLLGKFEGKK